MPPEFRRRFRGRLIVHDAEDEDLVEVGLGRRAAASRRTGARRDRPRRHRDRRRDGPPRRPLGAPARRLARGAASLGRDLAARDAPPRRAGRSRASSSGSWRRAFPVYGVSLVLNLPHVFGGYPYEEQILERIARSKARRALGLLPSAVRGSLIERVPRELTAAAALGGTPSAAHAEALLRGDRVQGRDARRAARRDRDRDPADDAVPAARAAEPGLGRVPRARPRAAALAQRASRSSPAGRRSCSTTSSDGFPRLSSRPTGRSSPTRGRPATATRCARPSGPRSPTRARSPTTAPAGRCIRSSRSSPGAPATRRSAGSGRCSSPAAATPTPRASSASCRSTTPARRSRWREGEAPSGSASCSRRRTTRWWSSRAPVGRHPCPAQPSPR